MKTMKNPIKFDEQYLRDTGLAELNGTCNEWLSEIEFELDEIYVLKRITDKTYIFLKEEKEHSKILKKINDFMEIKFPLLRKNLQKHQKKLSEILSNHLPSHIEGYRAEHKIIMEQFKLIQKRYREFKKSLLETLEDKLEKLDIRLLLLH